MSHISLNLASGLRSDFSMDGSPNANITDAIMFGGPLDGGYEYHIPGKKSIHSPYPADFFGSILYPVTYTLFESHIPRNL